MSFVALASLSSCRMQPKYYNHQETFKKYSTETTKETKSFLYLQVPVLVGINILDLGVVSLRAQVGPTANFVLQSKTLVDYSISVDGGSSTQQAEANTDKFDTKSIAWGLQAGLGLDVLKIITLDVNYNFGLSKVFNSLNDTELGNYFDFSNIDNTKQNLFMVTVGVKLL